MDVWRTVKSIASEMQVHQMTVYRLIHGGRLPATKVGRSYRIKQSDLDEYLKG
jgi:excisionase family DNA binding protein